MSQENRSWCLAIINHHMVILTYASSISTDKWPVLWFESKMSPWPYALNDQSPACDTNLKVVEPSRVRTLAGRSGWTEVSLEGCTHFWVWPVLFLIYHYVRSRNFLVLYSQTEDLPSPCLLCVDESFLFSVSWYHKADISTGFCHFNLLWGHFRASELPSNTLRCP